MVTSCVAGKTSVKYSGRRSMTPSASASRPKAKNVQRPRLSRSLPPDSKRLSSNMSGASTTLDHKYWIFRYYCRDGITVRKGNHVQNQACKKQQTEVSVLRSSLQTT